MLPIADMERRLKQFTADASHELGNPIMAVKTNTDVALKYPDGMRESDKEKFEAIQDASNQMTEITDALLDLARQEDSVSQPEYSCEPVDLTTVCKSLAEKQSAIFGHSREIKLLLPEPLMV